MHIGFFKHGYDSCKGNRAYELNVRIGKFQLRIGEYQVAAWWNYEPIFMKLRTLPAGYWD